MVLSKLFRSGSDPKANIAREVRKGTAIRRFASCKAGNIAMLFGMLAVPVTAGIGLSLDYGFALSERSRLQQIADSAILAGGREYQVTGETGAAEAKALTYFTNLKPSGSNASVLVNSVDTNTNELRFVIKADVPTSFLTVFGYSSIAVEVESKATLAQGGAGSEKHIELAMMLDTTGSMGSGTKMADLKSAARDLVQIVVSDDQSGLTSRIAIAPFAHAVNVGPYFQALTNRDPATVNSPCVVERAGVDAFTANVPSATASNFFGVYDDNPYRGSCKPTTEIVPLTADKTLLNSTIDGLGTTGYTAGHLGTGWAWYMISDKWSNFWPTASAPLANNPDEVMKVAVLMTDGKYNTYFVGGNGNSNTQAKALCDGMKSDNIVVYTVGFELNSQSAKKVLKYCATDPSKFFDAQDGDALRAAFRTIGFQLVQLRLSQ